ncbi:hypothetical protein AB0C07_30120 [Actinoplanes missouriensis]|uniref:hypothetical protein n=1 Tax=Actinoplanes missouriensis TaxID=1866 RepID=UPI003409D6F4
MAKFFGGLAAVLIALAAMAVFFGTLFYVLYGVAGFVEAFAKHHDISQIPVYLGPFALIGLWLVVAAVEEKIPKRAWRTRVVVDMTGAVIFGLGMGTLWALGMAGLLTGPRAIAAGDDFRWEWLNWALAHAPSVANPQTAALIGLVIAVPMAARSFWSIAPIWYYRGRLRIHGRPSEPGTGLSPGIRVWPGSPRQPGTRPAAPSARPRSGGSATSARPRSGGAATKAAPARTAAVWGALAGTHVRVGIATGVATFASVSAGWNESPNLFQILLSLIAATGTGALAAVQWRASSGKSK